MPSILAWVTNNPGAFASLVSAAIAASVSLIIFALTQFITHRKNRETFLAPKLEELYLLLNEFSEQNATVSKLLYLCLEGDEEARKQLAAIDELDLYGHRRAKRIIMYICLYFPRLQRIHQRLFAAERELNQVKFRFHNDPVPTLSELLDATGKVVHLLRLMEQEIVTNRNYLLEAHFWPRRYRAATEAEMEQLMPPPDVPFMSRH